MPSLSRRLAALVLLALAVAPLGRQPVAQAAQAPPTAPQQRAVTLPPIAEGEGPGSVNNTPASARPIGSATEQSWSQQIQGTIGSSGDVDYFSFTLAQPASGVRITLDGLPADYDLVLAGQPLQDQAFDPGQGGLEGITQIGGQISSIGGQISSIGGQISSIGGQISSIGGQISSIGGQISSISANSGTAAERIDTLLWLPGTYYAVVTGSNGVFSATPYSLGVEVTGSGLAVPPPAPEVALRLNPRTLPQVPAAEITTLYLFSPDRMLRQYPAFESFSQVREITDSLQLLAGVGAPPPNPNGAGPEYGAVINLGELAPGAAGLPTLREIYARWDADGANPLAANYLAQLIDNVVEAATTDGISGDGAAAPYYLGPSAAAPLTAFPNVRNVVIVGGDEIVPGFRLPDLTTIANEADYLGYLRQADRATGILDPASPQAAAQRYRMITSDSPYGAGRPYRFYGFPFYLPRLAVGRIVETPDDIASYLRNYVAIPEIFAPSYTIEMRSLGGEAGPRAFVGGYDFLKDQAAAIVGTLNATGMVPGEVTPLIDDGWTSADLQRAWFNGRLDLDFSDTISNSVLNSAPLPLASVNAHFDHWQVLPASGSAGNFQARRLLAPTYAPDRLGLPGGYFRAALGYSVGCHSGYNVLARSLAPGLGAGPRELYGADFAQAMNRHGGNWVGNTGYGYGTADGIDYSERLATLFTAELARDVRVEVPAAMLAESAYVGQSIGLALRNAKLRYVRNAASLSPYDYKALHVMTLYGLPFLRSLVGSPVAPPPEDPRPDPSGGASVPLETPAPYQPSEVGRLTRTITFTLSITDPANLRLVPRTGSTVIDLRPGDIAVEDEFVQRSAGSSSPFPQPAVRIFSGDQVGAPSLPAFAYDLSALSGGGAGRLRVKDVVFVGGTYGQIAGFNPQITQVATETTRPIVNTPIEPRFDAGVGIWYPDKFFSYSSVGEGEQQRDQLVTAAAQFRADAGGERGLLRPYRQMVFRVIYDDPGQTSQQAQQVRQDTQPPVIASVQVELQRPGGLAQSGRATVIVRAFDVSPGGAPGSGIDPADVSAVYVRDGEQWQYASFTRREQGVYTADLPVSSGAVRVIVRVTDRAGNTSYYTAKGSFQPPLDRSQVSLPLVRR